MSEAEPSPPRARILVALDASAYSLAALEAAVNLARRLEAELVGLFVEDVNLLRLASLPFAREVRLMSARSGSLDSQAMEQAIQRQAARARRALDEAAGRADVKATFRVVRGEVSLAVLEAALEADLLILGRLSRPLTRRRRSGSTAQAAAIRAPKSVLLTRRQAAGDHTIMVTYDGSALGRQALAQAAELARPDSDIAVVLLAAQSETADRLQTEAGAALTEVANPTLFYRLDPTDLAGLIRLARGAETDLLIALPLADRALRRLLDETECSLLIVRE